MSIWAQRSWLRKVYDNSAAHHEFRVQEHSRTWKADIRSLRRRWGDVATLPPFEPPEWSPPPQKTVLVTNGPGTSYQVKPNA